MRYTGSYCHLDAGMVCGVSLSTMPKVFEVNGYKFFFFSNEGNPLEPCHVHVRKNGSLAKFWIGKTARLENAYGFSVAEVKEIKRIADANIARIKGAWNGFFS